LLEATSELRHPSARPRIALPPPPTTRQNEGLGQETAVSGRAAGMLVNDQWPARHCAIRPLLSTTTHEVAVGQETPVARLPPAATGDSGRGAIRTGRDHREPSHVELSPPLSTAMQNAALTQDTPVYGNVAPSPTGSVQLAPFHSDTPLGPADAQNATDTHERAAIDPQSPEVRDQRPSSKPRAFP
jgi:hypothetical protein